MIYIGIDPGQSGGLVSLAGGGSVFAAEKMPPTERDICDWFRSQVPGQSPARALLEKVSASPQMGTVSAFTFGKGYGGLRMALTAAGIAFDDVRPQVWQSAMGCLTKGNKNVSKAKAQALFPRVKVTHAIADALLIAEYCRRLHLGGA